MKTVCAAEMTKERMQEIAILLSKTKFEQTLEVRFGPSLSGERTLRVIERLLLKGGISVANCLFGKKVLTLLIAKTSKDEVKEFFRRLIIKVTNRVLYNNLMPKE